MWCFRSTCDWSISTFNRKFCKQREKVQNFICNVFGQLTGFEDTKMKQASDWNVGFMNSKTKRVRLEMIT